MIEIGGYFELELLQGKEYHKDAIALNTGRNAFEYVLRTHKYKKVYLPKYTCEVMLEPIKKMSLEVEFYNINKDFYPVFDFNKIKSDEVFVYTNYFAICNDNVLMIADNCKNLIIDNSQAFFAKPLPNIDTFYSVRKFFGVPDGAYLYTNKLIDEQFKHDISYQRFDHLLGRIDLGANMFYSEFKENENSLKNQPIKYMSKLTKRILSSIDYDKVSIIRKENFSYLNNQLKNRNLLNMESCSDRVPMIYPFLIENGNDIKKILIKNKVFVATYWPNVLNLTKNDSFENQLVNDMIPIPVDHRYSLSNFEQVIKLIN